MICRAFGLTAGRPTLLTPSECAPRGSDPCPFASFTLLPLTPSCHRLYGAPYSAIEFLFGFMFRPCVSMIAAPGRARVHWHRSRLRAALGERRGGLTVRDAFRLSDVAVVVLIASAQLRLGLGGCRAAHDALHGRRHIHVLAKHAFATERSIGGARKFLLLRIRTARLKRRLSCGFGPRHVTLLRPLGAGPV